MMTQYLAVHNKAIIVRGELNAIIKKVKAIDQNIEPMIFELDTCKRVEFSWHGDTNTVLANASASVQPQSMQPQQAITTTKRGRPKLGVKSKEVTMLPRHWEWLAAQRGGASVTLRKLVDQAIQNASPEELIAVKQDQLHTLMSALADEAGFEEATRALYRNSKVSFEMAIADWPDDFKQLVMEKFNAINAQHQGKTGD